MTLTLGNSNSVVITSFNLFFYFQISSKSPIRTCSMVPISPGITPLILFLSFTILQALPLPQDENSSNSLGLTNEDAFNLIQGSFDDENHQTFPISEDPMEDPYMLGDEAKSDDMKRKFSAWAGKRSEVGIPWGNVLRHNALSGGVIRRGFNPWAGKRAFQPWAGKRSAEDEVEKRAFNPWAGKRSNDAGDKRGFMPWAGKRFDVDTQGQLEAQVADFIEKRNNAFSPWKGKRNNAFSPWKGKRSRPSGKRVFNPWAGK